MSQLLQPCAQTCYFCDILLLVVVVVVVVVWGGEEDGLVFCLCQ